MQWFAFATESTQGEGDLLSEIGSEIRVVIDRWSAGQIGVTDLILVGVILAVAGLLSFFVRRQARRLTSHLDPPASTAGLVIGRLVSLGLYLIASGLVLEVLGFSLGPVLILILIIWAAVVFARPLLADLNSGLALQLRGSVRIGDLVETNSIVGTIEGVSTRIVTLVTGDGRTVEIASSEVASHVLINYSTLGRRRSAMTLSLPEGANVVEIADRLRTEVEVLGHVLDEPPPEVVVTGFDGTRTCLTVLYWHDPELWAERVATDRVGRAVLELLGTQRIALSDPAIVIKDSETLPPARGSSP